MANKKPKPDGEPVVDARGQIALPVAGQNYILRPSMEAIEAIERELRPTYQLATDASRGALMLSEMAIICAEFMRAYGKANPDDPLATDYKGAQAENLAPLIYEAGIPIVCARLMVILVGALNGGYTAAGEAKAGTATA